MASWQQIVDEAPELAAKARAYFDAHGHKTIATIRQSGAPRISGTECYFEQGHLWFGSMGGSRKAQDLQRDPRFALHSGSDDPDVWKGDAKLSGSVEEITGQAKNDFFKLINAEADPGDSQLFRADIEELSIVELDGDPPDQLRITSWTEARGEKVFKRA